MRRGFLTFALWTSSLGAVAYMVRRMVRRRRSIDVGSVTDEWLAHQRGLSDY
jgi:hypothetical protein